MLYSEALGPFLRSGVQNNFLPHRLCRKCVRLQKLRHASLKCDLSASYSCKGSKFNHFVSQADHIPAVFHNKNRIVLIAKRQQKLCDTLRIRRMQTCSRFIKDIGDIGQAAAQMAYDLQTLNLSAGERICPSAKRQVTDAYIYHALQSIDDLTGNGFSYRRFDLLQDPNQVAYLDILHIRNIVSVDF